MRGNSRRRIFAVLVLCVALFGIFGSAPIAHADWVACATVDVSLQGQTFHEDECQVWLDDWTNAGSLSDCRWVDELAFYSCVVVSPSTP